MNRERQKRRLALTPVISALILSASVLVVGGAVWGFSQSAMTISAEDYAASMINMSETISERFIIEHVYYEEITVPELDTVLHVFVYNYGSVDIEVKIQVENEGGIVIPYGDLISIMAEGFAELSPISYTATSGDNLVITAYTRRGNSVYYRYIVP